MAEVCVMFRAKISVQFSGDNWASRPLVPVVDCVSREVVMFPAAKDIIGDGVEVVSTVFVTVIVVVTAGETVSRIVASGRSRRETKVSS